MTATMASPVLYLDIDFRHLRVEPWTRAISDVFTGKVEVIEYSRDRTIRGVSQNYRMPSVVRVLARFKRDRIRVKLSRLNIYARDGFVCQYDGQRYATEDLNLDHVVPRAQGGQTTWENVVCCCIECNSAKGNRTPEQAGMKLLRVPKKPHILPSVMVRYDATKRPAEWAGYWSDSLER